MGLPACGPGRGGVATPDEKVELGGIGNDTKASATSRSDHDHLLDGVMSAQTVSRPDCGVPAGEDANLHEGSTGFQAESGMTTSESRRRIRRNAAMAPRMMMGEIRFTGAVYGCPRGWPSSGGSEPVLTTRRAPPGPDRLLPRCCSGRIRCESDPPSRKPRRSMALRA